MAATALFNIPTSVDSFFNASQTSLPPDDGVTIFGTFAGFTFTQDEEIIIENFKTWLEEDDTSVEGRDLGFPTPPSSPDLSCSSTPPSWADSLSLDDVEMVISQSGYLSGEQEEGEGSALSPAVCPQLPASESPDEAVDLRTGSVSPLTSRGHCDSSPRADVYNLTSFHQVSPTPGVAQENVSPRDGPASRLPTFPHGPPDVLARWPLIPVSIKDLTPASQGAAGDDFHIASLDAAESLHVVPFGVPEHGFGLPSEDLETNIEPGSQQMGMSTLLTSPPMRAPDEARHPYFLPAASQLPEHAWSNGTDSTSPLTSETPWHGVRLSPGSHVTSHVTPHSTVSLPGSRLEGGLMSSREGSTSPEAQLSPTAEASPHRTKRKYIRKKPRTAPVLWEFLRDLLLNQRYNPTFVKWTNFEAGEFQIIKTGEVARLWGRVKGPTVSGKDMTYEKMSRALRRYYKQGIMSVVKDKRLVYSFGPLVLHQVKQQAVQHQQRVVH